jgi:CBS domain-containing protein
MACARDVMRTSTPAVGSSDSLGRVAEIMKNFAVRELPVVDRDALIGIIARCDLDPHVGRLEWTPVRVAMSAPVRTVGPDASIGDVARVLIAGRFNGIPVAVGSALAGMISRHDLLGLLAI